MSATVVKSMSTFKGADGKWRIRANSYEKNVHPHRFHTWEGSQGYDSREELEGGIINEFLNGMFQGGSRYSEFARELNTGVFPCHAYDRLCALDKLESRAGLKAVTDGYNKHDENAVKRWQGVAKRIGTWLEELRRELGRIYREEWKPCKDRYYVYVNGGIVSSRSEYRFRYFTNVNDNTIKRARQFTATAAHEFCRDFKQYGPRMVKIAA